ncbi:MAG: outer membrane beta-barrel protein [Bacteroidota bacterium]
MESLRVRFLYALFCCIVLLSFNAFPQETESELTRPSGFYAAGLYTSIADPIFRAPGESGELSVAQSKTTVGFNLNYLYLGDDWGGGIGLVYWDTRFNSFQAPLMPGSPNNVAYKDPRFSVFFVDLQLHALPWKIPLSFYGVLGLGSSTETYTISGAQSPFEHWNGKKDLSEFKYSYGLGIQVFLWKFISLQSEFRWIPGATTIEAGDYLYSRDGFDYYTVKDERTDNFVKVFSLGISVGGLW